MRILITGITGFAGGHLAEALLNRGTDEVFGVSRSGCWPCSLAHLTSRIQLFRADLCDRQSLERILMECAPDQIYHLAGHSDVGKSIEHPQAAWLDNFIATQMLYQAVDSWSGNPRIVYVGSGLAYGDPRKDNEVFVEDTPFHPVNPYGCSKAAADLLSYQYTRHPGLEIIRARPFNHIGPGQSPRFAVAHFAKQIAAIECGLQEPVLQTGNLSARRDITDVRDVVRAYLRLMEKGESGEAYNIASETVCSIHAILSRLLDLTYMEVTVRQRAHLLRASETPVVRVSSAKLRQRTEWSIQYPLERSLRDTLEDWRRNLTYSQPAQQPRVKER